MFKALMAAAVADTDRELFMEIDEDDGGRLASLEELGFVVARREHHYVLPTDPRYNGLAGCALPEGIRLASAADADPDRWRLLDVVLRSKPTARLGLIGVTSDHRRHGLARALLAAAFQVLHDRGEAEVSCEVDAANVASGTLMASLGARRHGGGLEMVRRP